MGSVSRPSFQPVMLYLTRCALLLIMSVYNITGPVNKVNLNTLFLPKVRKTPATPSCYIREEEDRGRTKLTEQAANSSYVVGGVSVQHVG